MGNRLNIRKKARMLTKQELIEMGEVARKERDRLLQQHPKLREFQKEIDRCLNHAGSFENRMAVLGIMIEGRLKDLQDQLASLSFLMRKIETPSHPSE